jgi:hypothetical protein
MPRLFPLRVRSQALLELTILVQGSVLAQLLIIYLEIFLIFYNFCLSFAEFTAAFGPATID